MKKVIASLMALSSVLVSCTKTTIIENPSKISKVNEADPESFTAYHIKKGEQYCDKNSLVFVSYNQLNFLVKFDSTAVYTTAASANQADINKLYGFSDNNAPHHEFSARIGWRWSNNALRLFAYVYNNGYRDSKEICRLSINSTARCSIKVSGKQYEFVVNGYKILMPRAASTTTGKGYKLYPYFGGDEVAPHDINIWIDEL